jgi:hypothetical protein
MNFPVRPRTDPSGSFDSCRQHSTPIHRVLSQRSANTRFLTGSALFVAIITWHTAAGGASVGVSETEPLPSRSAALDKRVRRLNLEQAVNRALIANRRLLDAQDRRLGANLTVESAASDFGLRFVPTIEGGVRRADSLDTQQDFGLSLAFEKRFVIGTRLRIAPQTTRGESGYRNRIDFRLTQPLFRGISPSFNRDSLDSARFADRSAQRAFHLTRIDVVLSTSVAVYEVVRQRQFVRLTEQSVERLKGLRFSLFQYDACPGNPVPLFTKDQMSNHIERRPAHSALINMRPCGRQVPEQTIQCMGSLAQNLSGLVKVVFQRYASGAIEQIGVRTS